MSTIVGTSLADKLKEIQTKDGLSDYKFAARLGISPQLWQMTRTRKREIGLSILKGIVRAYPELCQYVLIFLYGDVGNPTMPDSITIPPNMPISALKFNAGGTLRILCDGLLKILKMMPKFWRVTNNGK